jgi:MarR-like DNA-binding transcriptional regulator SgrR of sgrS sRNA
MILRSSLEFLRVLKDCPNGCTYDYVCHVLDRSKSNVIRALRELEAANMVHIHSTRGRGQKAVVRLSPDGLKVASELFSGRRAD